MPKSTPVTKILFVELPISIVAVFAAVKFSEVPAIPLIAQEPELPSQLPPVKPGKLTIPGPPADNRASGRDRPVVHTECAEFEG
jgi:hypothetical protein